MYQYQLKLITLLLLTVISACSVQNSKEGSAKQTVTYQDSVAGLMRFYREVSDMRGGPYLNELQRARNEFHRSPGKNNRLRLAIALMNVGAPDVEQHFREAETLLNRYIQERRYGFFNDDYSVLVSMLLSINQDWQRLNRQLVSAQTESAEAKRKLDELKSIEMQLNRSSNGYH